jgi:hypothetical protein
VAVELLLVEKGRVLMRSVQKNRDYSRGMRVIRRKCLRFRALDSRSEFPLDTVLRGKPVGIPWSGSMGD